MLPAIPIVLLIGLTGVEFSACQSEVFHLNVSYGPDPQQIMDIYLPPGRNATFTKVVVLIHGGGWSGGTKEGMNGYVPYFYYSNYAVVNMAYRLGSIASPGYLKQIQDIQSVLEFIKSNSSAYLVNPTFGLVGASAGAHLAMLFGYATNANETVHVICNLVGPASLLDPSYTNGSLNWLFFPLVGNYTFAQNPWVYYVASPVSYVSKFSPKTISFYGDQDPLIPTTQGGILEDKLDSVGVYNKFYLYQGGGHLNFTAEQTTHMFKKIGYFFENYM